jgi:hypothetical protein
MEPSLRTQPLADTVSACNLFISGAERRGEEKDTKEVHVAKVALNV